MKHISYLFLAGILSSQSWAASFRYSCEPSNDDGDSYGALLTIRVSSKQLRLQTTWDKKVLASTSTKSTEKAIVYNGLDYGMDEPSSVEVSKSAVYRGISPTTIKIDKDFEYLCKRAEQTVEWKNPNTDAGLEVITADDAKDSDDYKLGYAADLKEKKACFRGNAYKVIATIMADGIDHHGAESCQGPVVRGSRIVFPRCEDEDGKVYRVVVPRCPKLKL